MKTIPEHIENDPALVGRLKVRLTEALAVQMDESEWKKFSLLHGLDHFITDHPRFLRALKFGDSDSEGLILDVVQYLYDNDQASLIELFERASVERWFRRNDSEFLEIWKGTADPLVVALSHAVETVQQLTETVDLSEHLRRIEGALPSDPSQAIGATKDMLEATMRTILHKRGHTEVEKLDYPTLATSCFNELGLRANTAPSSANEKYVRKIANSAKSMIDAANELRNAAGTGHGRVIEDQPGVNANDASLVASTGLVLAAWMLRHSRDE